MSIHVFTCVLVFMSYVSEIHCLQILMTTFRRWLISSQVFKKVSKVRETLIPEGRFIISCKRCGDKTRLKWRPFLGVLETKNNDLRSA